MVAPDLSAEEVIVVVLLCIFSIVGSIGNALTLYIFTRHMKNEKMVSTYFILALAGTDFITCLVTIPYNTVNVVLQRRLKYDVACKIYHMLTSSTTPFSAFIMAAIATERYFAICRPLKTIITHRKSCFVIFIIAVLALASGVTASLCYGVYTKEYYGIDGFNVSNDDLMSLPCKTQNDMMEIIKMGEMLENRTPQVKIVKLKTPEEQTYPVCTFRIYSDQCVSNTVFLDEDAAFIVQRINAGCYLVCFLFAVVMYTTIYKSVYRRRAERLKQKSKAPFLLSNSTTKSVNCTKRNCVCTDQHCSCSEETQTDTSNHLLTGVSLKDPLKELREKNRVANIRTALILFIVNLIFIICFLPAWLMAMDIIQFNFIAFYSYFLYNVCNPFIYAFMNEKFRKVLWTIFPFRHCPRPAHV